MQEPRCRCRRTEPVEESGPNCQKCQARGCWWTRGSTYFVTSETANLGQAMLKEQRPISDNRDQWTYTCTPALQQLKVHFTTGCRATQQLSWSVTPTLPPTTSAPPGVRGPRRVSERHSYLKWVGAARDCGQCTRAPPDDPNCLNHLSSPSLLPWWCLENSTSAEESRYPTYVPAGNESWTGHDCMTGNGPPRVRPDKALLSDRASQALAANLAGSLVARSRC